MYKPTVKFEDVKNVTTAEYFSKDKYAVDMFEAKYAKEKQDHTRETPAEVFWRVSSGLAAMEKTKALKKHYEEAWFSLMWEGWFRPGGSVLAGVGATSTKSLLNCTTVAIEGDSLEAISKADYTIMKCAAFRQGLGFDGSSLRPRGAPVNNAAEASTGAVPWIEKLVDNGKWVGQVGRMPALLVSLKDRHPDIIEFITAKVAHGKIENANISVQISNKFMEAVKVDGDWELYFDFEEDSKYERISKIIKAKELFDLIAKTAFASAEPGVQYIDLLREGSIVHQIYKATGDERFKIISSNACSEKPLPNLGACNLLSSNQEKFSTDPEEYEKQLAEIVPYMVRMSDNVVSYELYNKLSPLKDQAWILDQTREVGIGITNVHGWFLKQGIAYDSDEAVIRLENFFKIYASKVFESSILLGKEKVSAPSWDLVADKSIFMKSSYFNNVVTYLFDGDVSKVTHMRNMAHMSIAPTGSLSSTFPSPCISSGIEPVIGLYYWRRTRAIDKGNYTYYFVIPPRLKDFILTKIEPNTEDYITLANFSGSERDDNGNVGLSLVAIINKYLPKDFFKPAHEIDYNKKIQLMASVYKWIDAAVSCTYNLPNTATVEDVESIYMAAYDHGVRAVSVYVDGSRQGILIFEDPLTNKAKFEKMPVESICGPDNRPISIIPVCAPKRPDVLECSIHHCSVRGTPWLVILGLMDGHPYEIFAGEVEEGLYVPKTCKQGTLTKKGGGKYSLDIKIRKAEVEYKDVAHALMTSNQRALTRLLSLSLRHGTPLEFIQQQLKKANGDITDFSAVVARVFGTYIKQYRYEKNSGACPECGKDSLMRMEGCLKCMEEGCSYSRCD